jgi:hypothetical protein
MFILLNGSFGVGKTTVAALVAASVPGVRVYNPEDIGAVLMRLPAWCLGLARQPDDFQDLSQWRALIVPAARWVHLRSSAVVIPMAFTNLAYFEAFAAALAKTAPVHRLCLVAPLEVVEQRLVGRGVIAGTGPGDWAFRRARECVAAHRDPVFGSPIDAMGTPGQIAGAIIETVGLGSQA